MQTLEKTTQVGAEVSQNTVTPPQTYKSSSCAPNKHLASEPPALAPPHLHKLVQHHSKAFQARINTSKNLRTSSEPLQLLPQDLHASKSLYNSNQSHSKQEPCKHSKETSKGERIEHKMGCTTLLKTKSGPLGKSKEVAQLALQNL